MAGRSAAATSRWTHLDGCTMDQVANPTQEVPHDRQGQIEARSPDPRWGTELAIRSNDGDGNTCSHAEPASITHPLRTRMILAPVNRAGVSRHFIMAIDESLPDPDEGLTL